jgi:hypothetical protein
MSNTRTQGVTSSASSGTDGHNAHTLTGQAPTTAAISVNSSKPRVAGLLPTSMGGTNSTVSALLHRRSGSGQLSSSESSSPSVFSGSGSDSSISSSPESSSSPALRPSPKPLVLLNQEQSDLSENLGSQTFNQFIEETTNNVIDEYLAQLSTDDKKKQVRIAAEHILNEMTDLLSFCSMRSENNNENNNENKTVAVHYDNALVSSIFKAGVLLASKGYLTENYVHIRSNDTVKSGNKARHLDGIKKAFSMEKAEKAVIGICYSSDLALSKLKLEKTINCYLDKNVSEIILYLGPDDGLPENIAKKESWLKANSALINKIIQTDSRSKVTLLDRKDIIEKTHYQEATAVVLSVLTKDVGFKEEFKNDVVNRLQQIKLLSMPAPKKNSTPKQSRSNSNSPDRVSPASSNQGSPVLVSEQDPTEALATAVIKQAIKYPGQAGQLGTIFYAMVSQRRAPIIESSLLTDSSLTIPSGVDTLFSSNKQPTKAHSSGYDSDSQMSSSTLRRSNGLRAASSD